MTNKKFSISEMKLFKACRQAWYLKYHEHLEVIDKSESLKTGLSYHSKIEDLYAGNLDVSDLSKESAMAMAYQKYIYPKFKVTSTEDWFTKEIGNGYSIIGRTDGIADDGTLVEHKTTSVTNLEEYEFDLQWDEQLMAYMFAKNVREIWYTICRKPNIRQKVNESDEEFFERMVKWFDEDTDQKIRVIKISRTDEQIEKFRRHLLKMGFDIKHSTDNTDANIYRNTAYCTKWGTRCEYANICLNYNPNEEYAGFIKDERRIDYGTQGTEAN